MYRFLDFDGVLHPYGAPTDKLFCHRDVLCGWLAARPLVEVVISSSWRSAYSLELLRDMVINDPSMAHRVIGVTSVLSKEDDMMVDGLLAPTRFEREAEVRRWLVRSPAPWARWAALDDQAWLFRPICPQLVLCDAAVGLTPERLNRVDEVLAHS